MRRVKLFVATSLDGFIAGPNEEVDWLFTDQDYGMSDFYNLIDTVLIGRKTYDFMQKHGQNAYEKKRNYVFSRTPQVSDHPDVEFVQQDAAQFVRSLRREEGKDIWLVGGANLFAYLLDHGLVEDIMLAVHPILIGEGIALFPRRSRSIKLNLVKQQTFNTGLVLLHYLVQNPASDEKN